MAIKCTFRRMESGRGHEHIAALGWVNPETGKTGVSTRAEIVDFIDRQGNNALYCPDQYGGAGAWVHVNSNGHARYPQTKADGRWTNNLLALPEG